MPSMNHDALPRAFFWILPLLNICAALDIYASYVVFDLASSPFIVSLAATVLQGLIGIYGCVKLRPGKPPGFLPPLLLLVLAGLWAGPLSNHAGKVGNAIHDEDDDYPETRLEHPVWSYVGLCASALCVIFTLVLLGISSGRCGVRTPSAYSSAFQNFRTQHPQPQPHQPPQAQGVSTAGYRAPPPEYSPPPLTTMTVPGAAAYLSSSSPSSPDMDKSGVAIEMVSPVSSSPATSSSSAGRPYDHDNRVDVIRRLCDLQQPDGHWEYSDELAGLARMWGGREVPTVAHGATALSQACLMELCDHVWAAQRDGTEDTALSTDEIASLQMMHWDLGFARGALDRSTAWLSGFR